MSQSASGKAGLGTNARRGPQKAHIPFRGDDLEHGKKTGKTVNKVSRDADDFEPFQEVLDQAYMGGNAPRAPNVNSSKTMNGKTQRVRSAIPDSDEFGEVSMEIDNTHHSPSTYFNKTVTPQPSSLRRAGYLSRTKPRGSGDVDYDRIPSPKVVPRRSSTYPINSSRLRYGMSGGEGSARNATSRGMSDIAADNHDDVPFDMPDPEQSPTRLQRNKRKELDVQENLYDYEDTAIEDDFAANGNHDDVGIGMPEAGQSPIRLQRNKRKEAAVQEDLDENEDSAIEDDIAANLQEVEEGSVDENERESSAHRNKKVRETGSISIVAKKAAKKQNPKRAKVTHETGLQETTYHQGLRRSQRRHYPPLEYWRQERVVWGRREKGPDKGPCYVPVIKEIITIPKPPPQPLGTKKRRGAGTSVTRSRSKSEAKEEVRIVEVDNPELGWDDDTQTDGIIIDVETGGEVERRVAFTAKMVDPRPTGSNKYLFHKVFGDGDFIAGGELVIPVGQEKPAKPTKDNTYIFYLIEGAVQFRVHRSTFVLATGAMFLVPRGNQYYIQNICQRDAKLFFAQARKIVARGESRRDAVLSRASAPAGDRVPPRTSSQDGPSPLRHRDGAARKS